MSKSSYQEAVNKARGIETPPNGETALAIEAIGEKELEAGIERLDAGQLKELARLAETGKIAVAPRMLTLDSGQMIRGTIDSMGEAEIEDPVSKGMKKIRTYQLTLASGARVSILGAAQLDRMLPPLVGRRVIIARGETHKHKGARQLTEYFVAEDLR